MKVVSANSVQLGVDDTDSLLTKTVCCHNRHASYREETVKHPKISQQKILACTLYQNKRNNVNQSVGNSHLTNTVKCTNDN